ncbi:MAG: Gfo/Idh/MocA family oxidoreductase [Acidimicrobiales bacterium]
MARPPDPTVTLAFAGTGSIAAVHGYAVEHVPGLSITKVASRDFGRATESARRLGAEPCRYDELPAGADGVVICTPPGLHAELALASVGAGAAVLVEKPLCTTLADADALVAAERQGARIAYAENLVHAPAVRLALDHAAQLEGTDVLDVRALQARPTWGDFLTPAWGGGVLFDLGVHPLAVALLLAAPAQPKEVRAELSGAADHPVDEHAEVHLAFGSGLLARVTASWRDDATPAWDAQVSAPDGVVRLELLPEVRLERNGVDVPLPAIPRDVPPQLEELGYLPQIESFALDVAHGRVPEVGAAFGRRVLDVTCAAYASAGAGGAWVPLPFAGPRDRPPIDLWKAPEHP